MSSRIFQSIIIQMKDATDRCIGVVDDQGVVAACSELSMIGTKLDDFHGGFGDYPDQIFTSNFRTYKPVGGLITRLDYAVFVDGHDATARCVCILASVAFQEAKINYEEKHNKTIFVKNIISDNILPGDIYVRAKELHFATDVPRAVLLIRQTERTDMAALEAISNMFPDRQKDFVLSINETDLVLLKACFSTQRGEACAARPKTTIERKPQWSKLFLSLLNSIFAFLWGRFLPFHRSCSSLHSLF